MIAIGTVVRSLVTGRDGVVSSNDSHRDGCIVVKYPTEIEGVRESIAYSESEIGTEDDRRALIEIIALPI
jgi:hypothetical protein